MVSTPSPPDPYATAKAQGEANKEASVASSIVNNPLEVTPFGSKEIQLARLENQKTGEILYRNPKNNRLYRTPDFSDPSPGGGGPSRPGEGPGYWDNKGAFGQELERPRWVSTGKARSGPAGITDADLESGDWTPRYRNVMTLSPEEQRKQDLSNKIATQGLETGSRQMDAISRSLSRPLTTAGLPALRTGPGPINLQRNLSTERAGATVGNVGRVRGNIATRNDQQARWVPGMVGDVRAGVNARTGQVQRGITSRSGQVQRGVNARTGQVQRGINSRSGQVQRGVNARTGQVQRGINSRSGQVQRDINSRSGQVQGNISGLAGQVQGNISGLAGQVQGRIGSLAGQVQREYTPGDGFQDDRRRVERAIMSRIAPDFDRDRQELEGQLVSQGLVRGSAAFNDAMEEVRRAETDARMQAVLAGGQEQSRLLGEARAAGNFRNAAVEQKFGQNLAAGNFRNAAVGQKFGQNLAAGNFRNAAVGQKFGQNLAAGNFRNAAVGQKFEQDAEAMARRNAAVGQMFGQDAEAMARRNAAVGQMFGQDIGAQQANNAAVGQMFGQDAEAMARRNAAVEQMFGQNLAAGNFRNAAVGQMFGQDAEAMARRNAAVGQMFGQDIGAQQANNAAIGQRFSQGLEAARFRNAALQERFARDLAGADLQNAAVGQRFQQQFADAQMRNALTEQNNLARARELEIENRAALQEQASREQAAAMSNQARAQGLQERAAVRTQPLNELSAFLSGGQVNIPQFEATYRQGIEPAPIADSVYRSYELEAQAAAQKNQGIFGLASGLLRLPFAFMG